MKKPLFVLVAGLFLLAAGFGVFLRPLLYTLTPLQRKRVIFPSGGSANVVEWLG